MSEGTQGFVFGVGLGAAALFALWRLKGRPEVLRLVREGISNGERDVPELFRPTAREVLFRIGNTVVASLDSELP